jgi:beta-N-acetylhexosaminidase
MLDGVKNGIITEERLDEAVTRILALKASLGLHRERHLLEKENLEHVLQCQEHIEIGREVADKNITLVKNKEDLLPLDPAKYKRIKIIQCTNEKVAEGDYLPELKYFREKLEKEGFEVQYFNDCKYPGGGISLKQFQEETDLIIYFANMKVGSNQTTIRLVWNDFLGEDSPKYVNDIPTLFLSFSNPYHLVDVPMVKTYINAYACNHFAVDAMVEKLMGRSEFKGISPVDPFAGLWDTRL